MEGSVSIFLVLGYAATSFASAAIHNLFLSYYVHLFMVKYGLSDAWFYFGEAIFMAWNSINDPLIAYLMDGNSDQKPQESKKLNSQSVEQCKPTSCPSVSPPSSISDGRHVKIRHIHAIRYGGFLWVFSLLFLFSSYAMPSDGGSPRTKNDQDNSLPDEGFWSAEQLWCGLHFTFCLCLYDTFLSYVMLAHGALLADFTADSAVRAKCNMMASFGGVFGSLSVMFSHFYWDLSNLQPFRNYSLCVGLLALAGFQITAATFQPYIAPAVHIAPPTKGSTKVESKGQLFVFIKQLLSMRNFWSFVGVNIIQVFNCHFNSNFLTIFLDEILPSSSPSSLTSSSSDIGNESSIWSLLTSPTSIKMTVMSLGSVLPHFGVILCVYFLRRYGLFLLIRWLVSFKVILSLACAVITWILLGAAEGTESISYGMVLFIAIYLLVARVSNEIICRHGNLVLADIVDEDNHLHNRIESKSSMIYGVNAFFTKPGQSLAPMAGWLLLSSTDIVNSTNDVTLDEVGSNNDRISFSRAKSILLAVTLVPLACGVLQHLLWRMYTLHGQYLSIVKNTAGEAWKEV